MSVGGRARTPQLCGHGFRRPVPSNRSPESQGCYGVPGRCRGRVTNRTHRRPTGVRSGATVGLNRRQIRASFDCGSLTSTELEGLVPRIPRRGPTLAPTHFFAVR